MCPVRKKKQSNRHLKWVRLIHSYSAMAVLVSMLFFAITGLTLNHREWFPATSSSYSQELLLPEYIFSGEFVSAQVLQETEILRAWLEDEHGLEGRSIQVDWDEDEQVLILDVKKPGGYTLAELDLGERKVLLEKNEYGVITTLNDLHMGRNSGLVWSWFIDISSIAMLLFSITGLWLVLPQKKRRERLFGVGVIGSVVMFIFYLMAF